LNPVEDYNFMKHSPLTVRGMTLHMLKYP